MGRIGVLISGSGTNLQALIDATESGKIQAQLVCVISNRADAYGLERARQHGIDAYVLQNCHDILEKLQDHGVDLLVLAGYLKRLPSFIVQAYPDRIINVHPSLIPAFSGQGFYGLHVHQAALERGVKVSGATVHIVNEDLDEGPILKQEACPVYADDRPEDLQARVLKIEHGLLTQAVAEEIEKLNNTAESK